MKTIAQIATERQTRRLGDPLPSESRHLSPAEHLQRTLHSHPLLGPAGVLVLAVSAFTIIVGTRFVDPLNISLIFQQVQIIGMVGVAQTIVILTAGIDLSVGAVMVFTTIAAGKLSSEHGVPGFAAIILGVLVGMICGIGNGVLVSRFRVPPFIATLGTLSIFTALTISYSQSQTIRANEVPAIFLWPGQTFQLFGTPVTYGSVSVVAAVIAMAAVLRWTAWGEHVYMTGDNPEGARLSGIRTGRVLISVYATAGALCGVAGWFLVGRVGSISPFSGENLNLASITAVVIGGTSLFGGRGHVVGTLLGALIVGVFSNGLTLAGVDVVWQTFTTGVLVIGAVGIDQWTRKVAG